MVKCKNISFTQMSTSGYKSHSRLGGWNKGTVEQTDVPFTLTHDRDIQFMIDKIDVDETNETASIKKISEVFHKNTTNTRNGCIFLFKSCYRSTKIRWIS